MCCKFFVALICFYIKPTCFRKHLHRRQGQSDFYILIFILNDDRKAQFLIFWGTTAQIFGAKKDMVSVPYLIIFGFLLYGTWQILRLYVGGRLSFIMSPIIAGEKPWRNLYISIAKLWIFLWWIEKESSFSRRAIKWWFIIRVNNS